MKHNILVIWHSNLVILDIIIYWGRLQLRSSSIELIFYWGHLPLSSSSNEVVFHCSHLPLRSSFIQDIFYWGCLPFRSSSIYFGITFGSCISSFGTFLGGWEGKWGGGGGGWMKSKTKLTQSSRAGAGTELGNIQRLLKYKLNWAYTVIVLTVSIPYKQAWPISSSRRGCV